MALILVIDDDTVCRELIREALGTAGLQVIEAPHGLDVFDIIRDSRPEVVLLDIQMPHATGYDVLERIRSDPETASLKVAALTAYAMRGDRERGISAGFDDYITKPIEIPDLRTRVLNLLRSCSHRT